MAFRHPHAACNAWHVKDDPDTGSPDADDAFDRQVGHVLDTESAWLAEQCQVLLARGSMSAPRQGLLIRAQLRPPRWWRPGVLKIWAEDSGGGRSASSVTPLGRTSRQPASLTGEITLQLAVMLAGSPD